MNQKILFIVSFFLLIGSALFFYLSFDKSKEKKDVYVETDSDSFALISCDASYYAYSVPEGNVEDFRFIELDTNKEVYVADRKDYSSAIWDCQNNELFVSIRFPFSIISFKPENKNFAATEIIFSDPNNVFDNSAEIIGAINGDLRIKVGDSVYLLNTNEGVNAVPKLIADFS